MSNTNKTPQWEKDFYKEFLERPYEEGIIYADGELVKAFIKEEIEKAEQRGSEQSLRSVTPEILKIVAKWNEFTSGHDDDWIYDCSFEFFDDLSRGEMVRLMDELKAISDERSEESVAIRERTRIIKALEGLKKEKHDHISDFIPEDHDDYRWALRDISADIALAYNSAIDQAIKAVEKGKE